MSRRGGRRATYGRTVEFNALPRLGERPGIVLFPWRRLVVAGLAILIVAAIVAARIS